MSDSNPPKGAHSESIELTFAQQQEIDKFLEDYRYNHSNTNKARYGLFAYIDGILATQVKEATQGNLDKPKNVKGDTPTADALSARIDELDKILLPTAEAIADEWGSGETGKDALPYVYKLKAHLTHLISKRVVEELKRWRTMIQRLSEYVDSPDSLTEYDDRIKELEAQL